MSKEQKELQQKCLVNQKEIYINAVCGSGKTEITYEVIKDYLSKGLRVGIAIPRKAIVLELYYRLKSVFKGIRIRAVYGGNNRYIDGDIVIFTTHQSYLFFHSFGLLIIDEYDAFPLKGNECLKNITKQTTIEKSIYLSATFLNSEFKEDYILELNKRYHNHKLDIPNIIVSNNINNLIKLTSQVHKYYLNKQKILVFFPRISDIKTYSKLLTILGIKHFVIYAGNSDDIKRLKQEEYFICLTSIILERGITIPNVNVIVYNADHSVFSYATLIQISGRVGRHYLYPSGEITFYARKYQGKFDEVINRIKKANESLSDL